MQLGGGNRYRIVLRYFAWGHCIDTQPPNFLGPEFWLVIVSIVHNFTISFELMVKIRGATVCITVLESRFRYGLVCAMLRIIG